MTTEDTWERRYESDPWFRASEDARLEREMDEMVRDFVAEFPDWENDPTLPTIPQFVHDAYPFLDDRIIDKNLARAERSYRCGDCGGIKPPQQSCLCFDNHCE